MKYYLVCKKELPTIKKDDRLVGHVTASAGYDTLYPKIESIKELKKIDGNDYVKSIHLYEIEMESVEKRFTVEVNSYFFILSHHDARSREYYETLLKKDLNIFDNRDEYRRWVNLRFKNGVKGRLYKTLFKAEEVLKNDLKIRNEVEQSARQSRLEEYKKLKQEFEPC